MQTDYPDYLIDAVPGARKLADEVDKLIAEAAPLNAAVAAAIKARQGKVRGMRHGTGEGDVRLVPATGVTTAEFDELNAAKATAEAAQSAHARKVAAARSKFDSHMRSVSAEERRTIAGPVAESAYREATEALSTLESALVRAQEAGAFDHADTETSYRVSFSLQPAPRGFGPADTPSRALAILRAHLATKEARA